MKLQIGDQIIDVERQLQELDRVDQEESLYKFLKAGWKYIDPAPWQDGWPIQAVAEHLEAVASGDIRNLIINIPPRCSKSSLVSVAFPAWNWAQPEKYWTPTCGPGVQFLAASYAQKLSIEHSIKCRRLIKSPWYQQHWGKRFSLTSDQDAKMRFENDKGGYRFITSVDSGVTGSGGQCFVAGTLVSTPQGVVPIEEIRPQALVLGFDTLQEKVVKSRVLATAAREASDIHEVRLSSGIQFRCTGDHPIYTAGQRYVAAGELRPGDRLVVLGENPQRSLEDSHAPEVRPLCGRVHEAAGGFAQAPEVGVRSRLLLKTLPGPSRVQQEIGEVSMRDLQRETSPSQEREILLGRMQGGLVYVSPKKADMSSVSCGVRCSQSEDPEYLLHDDVSESGSRRPDAGIAQLAFSEDRPLFESISQDAPADYGAGSELLCNLRNRRSSGEVGEKNPNHYSHSPHKREFSGEQTGELVGALSPMPQRASSWELDDVISVERIGGEPQCVYDIQVEGCHNFFANSVLAHNCIILDDPNDASDDSSEAAIASAIAFWDGTISTRLNDPNTGSFIVVQQRIAEDDITGHILSSEQGDWTHLMLPMFYEPARSFSTLIGWKDPRQKPGELLWPERFSEPTARALEKRLGPFRSSGQLQQSPEPQGGGIIKREWWQPWDADAFPPMDYILASVDTAYTEKTMNDPSAMTVWGVFTQDPVAIASRMINAEGRPEYLPRTYTEQAPKVMLMGGWAEHLEFHDLVLKVAATAKRLKCDKVLVENKASGISVAQELRRVYNSENFAVQLNDPKSQDKISRLYSVQHIFNDRTVYAPDRKWADEVITQVAQFPKSANDDLTDTVSQALRHLRDLGLLIRAPERLAEIDEMRQYAGKPPGALYPS